MDPIVWQDLCSYCTNPFLEGEISEMVDGKKLHRRCVDRYQDSRRSAREREEEPSVIPRRK